jgi:quercetin dioxygenase-like cupin family protein
MKPHAVALASIAIASSLYVSLAQAQVALTPAELKWEPSPTSGAKISFLLGRPSLPGPFIVRVSYPAGAKTPPHSHNIDVAVTVLSGTIAYAEGDRFDEAKLKDFPAGSFYVERANVPHYFAVKTDMVFQASGTGPQSFDYVNAKDDPRNK